MVTLNTRHVVTTLLHPYYRSLKKIPDYLNVQSYKYVRDQMKQLRNKQEENKNQKPTELPIKKVKTEKKMFSRFESGFSNEETDDNDTHGNENEEYNYNIRKNDELDYYLLCEFDHNKQTTEPLAFWKMYREQFSLLSKVARSILSIPATIANAERKFSSAGWTLNERRTSLQPDKLENILLARSTEKHSRQGGSS